MRRISPASIVSWIILLVMVVVTLIPLYVLGINAIKPDVEVKASPITFPSILAWENFPTAFEKGGFARALLNSLKLAVVTSAILVPSAGFAAYALARMRVPGRLKWNTYLLFGMAVPPQLFLIPLYSNLSSLGLTNSHLGIIIVYIGIYIPFSVFFLRSFFLGMPKAIEEAARIDGCSSIQVVTRIILPMARTALLSLVLIIFTWVWNEFTFSVTLLQSDPLKTAATQYLSFVSSRDVDLSLVAASGIITTIPILVLFICLQHYFIEGMTAGSVK